MAFVAVVLLSIPNTYVSVVVMPLILFDLHTPRQIALPLRLSLAHHPERRDGPLNGRRDRAGHTALRTWTYLRSAS